MDCELALEALSAALDGELSPQETQELNAHLEQCPACRALAQELSALHDACGALEVTPPGELKDHIMAHLPTQEPVKIVNIQPKTTARRWQRWGAMAAVFALVCLAAWQLPRFLFTDPPQANISPDTAKSVVTAEGSAETAAPFSAEGGENADASAQPAGGVESSTVTGYAAEDAPAEPAPYSDRTPVEAPADPTAQPADASSASADIPLQSALADSTQKYSGMISGAATPSSDTASSDYQAQKAVPSLSVPAASASPEAKEAAMADQAPAPQPALAPEASPTAPFRVLLTSQNLSQGQDAAGAEGEKTTVQEDGLQAELDGGDSSLTRSMPASAVPSDDVLDPSASLYTRSGGAAPQDALTAELPPETEPEQPQVNTEEFEEVVPAEDALPIYCGEITLLEGQLLGDYPKEEHADGTVWYTLPAHQFWALLRQLEAGGLPYQFQPTGGHIDPAATQGLVILPAG